MRLTPISTKPKSKTMLDGGSDCACCILRAISSSDIRSSITGPRFPDDPLSPAMKYAIITRTIPAANRYQGAAIIVGPPYFEYALLLHAFREFHEGGFEVDVFFAEHLDAVTGFDQHGRECAVIQRFTIEVSPDGFTDHGD